MKTTLKCLAATALLAFICLPVLEAQDDRCPEADSRTAAELADTIRSGKLRAVCMDRSIRRLGTLHAVDAIPLLINLLDYKRDPEYSETLGVQLRLGDWYPAVVALFEIGKPALPNLLKLLAGGDPKSVAFHKGVEAYMTITREDRVPSGDELLTGGVFPRRGNDAHRHGRLLGSMHFMEVPYTPSARRLVYKIDPNGYETVLHSFNLSDGWEPIGIVPDAAGDLYGATEIGGAHDGGAVFKLDPAGEEKLHFMQLRREITYLAFRKVRRDSKPRHRPRDNLAWPAVARL